MMCGEDEVGIRKPRLTKYEPGFKRWSYSSPVLRLNAAFSSDVASFIAVSGDRSMVESPSKSVTHS